MDQGFWMQLKIQSIRFSRQHLDVIELQRLKAKVACFSVIRSSVDIGGGQTKLLDIVGTGGDGADTINISTASVVLAAACGCIVAKAGNRSVSSACSKT